MKSLLNALLTVAKGIIADASSTYPEYRDGLEKDLTRLSRLAESRGIGLFTLDLPSLDALLLRGLEDGRLSLKGPLTKRVSKRIHVPVLFRGLWLRVFQPDLCLRDSDIDSNAILFLRQLCRLGKNLELGCSTDRNRKALKDFHDVENHTRSHALAWQEDDLDSDSIVSQLHFGDAMRSYQWFGREVDERGLVLPSSYQPTSRLAITVQRFQRYADIVARSLGSFDPIEFSRSLEDEGLGLGLRHGPGAVSERTGLVHKYEFVQWPDKLQKTFPFELFGKTIGSPQVRPISLEAPSRLIAVPKTSKGPRLIAAEPTQHMWVQQLIRRFIEERYWYTLGDFIAFRSQEPSRAMVRSASLHKRLATVDLSSASDRISCWAIERFFRENPSLLNALHGSRTRWMVDAISGDNPAHFFQRKFVSQGTAVTFPVMTLFLTVATLASLPAENFDDAVKRYRGKVRVFGDDILLPKAGYVALCELLHYLGLAVNQEKCFLKGSFRESCGMDAFQGDDVTPVSPRSLNADGPASRDALIRFSNNLFCKGFWHAAKAVESIDGSRFMRFLPIVDRDSGVIGRVSFTGFKDDHLQKRWNSKLHRWEVRAWTVRSRARRKPTNDYPGLLQYFTEAPDPFSKWEHGILERPKTSDGLGWEVSHSGTL